jgi:6-phospho-3-hexuloisomerase
MKLHQLTDGLSDELKGVLRGVRDEDVKSLEREIQRRGSIFTTGAGRTFILMRPFAMRLMQYGFNSHIVGETTTPRMNKNDLLLAASARGATVGVIRRAEEARALGGRVFAITSNPDSPLIRIATGTLIIPAPKRTIQFGTNWFEQGMFLLLEAISLRLAKKRGITIEKLMVRHANLE